MKSDPRSRTLPLFLWMSGESIERLADIVLRLERTFGSLDTFVARCREGALPTPFVLMDQIRDKSYTEDAELAPLCLYPVALRCVLRRSSQGLL
jgi:hypothetical protein